MSDKTRICSTCDKPKPDPDGFPKKGAQCKGCIAKKAAAAYQAKAAGGGSAVKSKSKATPKTAAAPLRLDIDACFGFSAVVNGDGYLDIQQRDSTGEITDTVVMSRTEFRMLVEKFSPWAAAA